MEAALTELETRLGELTDLRRAQAVLAWDMLVWMPSGGQRPRAAQLETLEAVIHARQTDERLGELFEELGPYAASLPADADVACLVRIGHKDWEKARRVPTELAAEIMKVGAESYEAWVKAREDSDFPSFAPWFERMLDLRLRYVDCFAPYDDPYDVLLDDYEPEMRTEEVRRIFATLTPELVDLVAEHGGDEDDEFLRGPFPVDAQKALSWNLVLAIGGTPDSFRLDTTVHPFETTFGLHDIRLTTRYAESDLNSLFTALHEGGHGLVEQGVSPSLDRTPLCAGCSSALHESQSRMWENIVGRSLPFWRWFYPRVQAAFPEVLHEVSVERFHRAVNRVRPSLVRVDADEATYGLHIILRFELEQELLSGRLAVKDLPDAWNVRFEELLGLEVPNDRLGVLQDAHWSTGSFGYFPTYQLGNVISVQIWEKVRAAIPDVEEQIERGELHELGTWLRENLYALGRKFTPAETIERVAGGPIDPQPYLRYLRQKFGTLATV